MHGGDSCRQGDLTNDRWCYCLEYPKCVDDNVGVCAITVLVRGVALIHPLLCCTSRQVGMALAIHCRLTFL